jgi:hypothetical protein
MPSTSLKNQPTCKALLHLPKDKEILDFVWKKLTETCGPDKSEMLQDLLEMHRTSNGFDPMELSKGRVKRIKASDFKRTLIEIDVSLQGLINGPEYKELISQKRNFGTVLAAFRLMHEKLERQIFDAEMASELDKLKRDLVDLEEYELLLCLYRLCHSYYENEKWPGEINNIIEEYNQVKLMAELYGEHTQTGLRTLQLVSQAIQGNRNNQALIALYDQLCKLLIRQSGTKAKYETLTRIIRVSAHLENRKHYMEPYLTYIQSHFEEIISVIPTNARELHITMAVFLNRETLPVRLGYLNKAIEDASKDRSHHDVALFKIIHAELCCDGQDYETALKMLDEADFILSKINANENTPDIRLRSTITRFFIYALLKMEGRKNLEPDVFNDLITVAGSLDSKRQDLKIIQLELQAFQLFIFSNFIHAKPLFIKCSKYRENQALPVFYIIDSFFQELLRKSPDLEVLRDKILQLEQMKETFYSTLWVRMLKGAIVKREIHRELVL